MKSFKITPYVPKEINVESISKNEVRIIAYPFEAGYAITIAHPIRRLLLTSSVGYAPIAIKISGASHEFDSVRGMLEDIALFIINLKNIRFKINGAQERIILDYSFNGPKVIKGEDLQNESIEIVSKDAYLATLNEDAVLSFSVIIQKGIGYVPSENIRGLVPEGYIPLDAYFTPVKKAVYDIQNMLVEDDPNFEKLIFEIATDGQIDPINAFKDALSIMYKQMAVFNSELNVQVIDSVEVTNESPEMKILLQKVENLNLSARSFNCLDRSNIKYVGELVLMKVNEIESIKNLGKKSLDEILQKLEEIGYPAGTDLGEELTVALKRKIEKLKLMQ